MLKGLAPHWGPPALSSSPSLPDVLILQFHRGFASFSVACFYLDIKPLNHMGVIIGALEIVTLHCRSSIGGSAGFPCRPNHLRGPGNSARLKGKIFVDSWGEGRGTPERALSGGTRARVSRTMPSPGAARDIGLFAYGDFSPCWTCPAHRCHGTPKGPGCTGGTVAPRRLDPVLHRMCMTMHG